MSAAVVVGSALLLGVAVPAGAAPRGAPARSGSAPLRESVGAATKLDVLSGVSCSAPDACTAVGYQRVVGGSELVLVERWDGTSWMVERTPAPVHGRWSAFSAVSCPSADDCVAVGAFLSADGFPDGALTEVWNGTTWALEPTPDPVDTSGDVLSGVSCSAPTTCTAVGVSSAGTLAENWNGATWTIVPTPNPYGNLTSTLDAVACTSASACTAVGAIDPGQEGAVTLAESWNGTTWTVEPTPDPFGADESFLSAVACTSADDCTATGTAYRPVTPQDVPLVEVWNGTIWSIEHAPTTANQGNFDGVSCSSTTSCTAVGWYENKNRPTVLVESWNGAKWSIVKAPGRGTGSSAEDFLEAVSCSSVSACTAVGFSATDSTADATLAEGWNGTKWSIEPTPDP